MRIVIVDYGVGNIQSLKYAIARLGGNAILSDDRHEIMNADRVFFPGVGEAKNAMKALKAKNLDIVVKQLKVPTLGICLGMQLMCNQSDEGNTTGLGIFDCTVTRFSNRLKVPQIGWNTLSHNRSPLFKGIDNGAYMYSVHSYYVPIINQTIAESNYGIVYSATIRSGNFFGVQFHPEKSSLSGQQLLANFLKL